MRFTRYMAAVLIALLPVAPAKATYCWDGGATCDYVYNSTFSYGGWNGSIKSWSFTYDPCGTFNNEAGNLTAADSTVYHDPAMSITYAHNRYYYAFDIIVDTTSGATAWDRVDVHIDNLTTGTRESYSVFANQLNGNCQRFTVNLSNDYDGDNVRITFKKSRYSSFAMYVDNVNFYGTY